MTIVFYLLNFVIKKTDRLKGRLLILECAVNFLLSLEDVVHCGQTSAYTKSDHKRANKIKEDVALIGLTCLAVVLRVAALAFDMGEHGWANSPSPPGVADFLCVTLSAVGTGGILNWVFHEVPPENEMSDIILQEKFILPYHTNVGARPHDIKKAHTGLETCMGCIPRNAKTYFN